LIPTLLEGMERMASDPKKSHRNLLLYALIILLIGSSLRLLLLTSESLWLDEATSVILSERNSSVFWDRITRETNPPLYYLLLRLWIGPFGRGEASVRLPSVIFGIGSLILIFLVASSLFSKEVGLFASLILSVSLIHISYSQEARGYAMMCFLSLLSIFLLIRFTRKVRRLDLLALSLSNVALLYTHVYGSFVVLAEIVFIAYMWLASRRGWGKGTEGKSEGFPWEMRRRDLGLLAISQVLVLFTILPWVFTILPQLGTLRGLDTAPGTRLGLSWIHMPRPTDLVKTVEYYSGGNEIRLLLFTSVFALGLLSVRRATGAFSWRRPLTSLSSYSWVLSPSLGPREVLLLLWLGVPIVLPFLFSVTLFPIYAKHYTIAASLPFFIIVARGVQNVRIAGGREAGILLICLFVASSGVALIGYYSEHQKEEWREAEAYISQNLGAREIMIFNAPYMAVPFWYYYRGHGNKSQIKWAYTREGIQEILGEKTYPGVWLVLSHDRFTDPHGLVKEELDSAYEFSGERDFVGIRVLHYLTRKG